MPSKPDLYHVLVLNLLFSFIMVTIPTLTRAQNALPPAAKKIPHVEDHFGDIRNDNYYWLKDKSDPEVIKYLEEENTYTQSVMKPTEQLQEKLYKELLGRIKETDLTVPHRIDDYFYYSRTEQGKNYPIYCRKKGSLDAPEELILDVNILAEGHKFFSVGAVAVSPNHNFMAFSTDTTGSETYTLFVKDFASGQLLTEQIPNTYYGVVWGNDNQTLFYITLDYAKRPYRLYRHKLGSDYQQDQLVHHETDEAFYVNLSKTRSKKYVLLSLESNTTTEVRYLDADKPEGDFQIIHPRQHEMEYSVDHHGDKFFILTNENAKNFKLMEAPVSNPDKTHWKEIIPHNPSGKLDNIEAFQNHLAIYEREKGLRKIHIKNLTTGQEYDVKFPEPAYVIWPSINPEFKTNQLRFEYSSLVTPRTVYDYNMDTQEKEIKKQYEVLGGYDPAQYESERIFAQAKDGTSIPISLVYKKGTKKD